MTDDHTDLPALDALPDSARTVLLAGPPTDQLRAVCPTLHRANGDSAVLFVTYTRTPDACLEDLTEVDVGEVVVVSVGDAPPGDAGGVTTRQVSAPADLTQLGIAVGDVIDEHDRLSVCFDSVTTTLQYADYEDVYELVHAVTGRIQAAGGRAHFHINPIAHDEQVVAGLTTLFDARVDVLGAYVSVEVRPLLADSRNG